MTTYIGIDPGLAFGGRAVKLFRELLAMPIMIASFIFFGIGIALGYIGCWVEGKQ